MVLADNSSTRIATRPSNGLSVAPDRETRIGLATYRIVASRSRRVPRVSGSVKK